MFCTCRWDKELGFVQSEKRPKNFIRKWQKIIHFEKDSSCKTLHIILTLEEEILNKGNSLHKYVFLN